MPLPPPNPLLSQRGSESGSEKSKAVGSSQMVPWLGEGRAIKTEVMSLQPAGEIEGEAANTLYPSLEIS